MADHGQSPSQPTVSGMGAHRATYQGFLQLSMAGVFHCLFVLVALVTFRFMDYPLNLLVGFGGLIIGTLVILISLRMGGKWIPSVILLVVYALFVANKIHMS